MTLASCSLGIEGLERLNVDLARLQNEPVVFLTGLCPQMTVPGPMVVTYSCAWTGGLNGRQLRCPSAQYSQLPSTSPGRFETNSIVSTRLLSKHECGLHFISGGTLEQRSQAHHSSRPWGPPLGFACHHKTRVRAQKMGGVRLPTVCHGFLG